MFNDMFEIPSEFGISSAAGEPGIGLSVVVFAEEFIGDGSTTTFQLAGNIIIGTFTTGIWDANQILTTHPKEVTSDTKKPIYQNVILGIGYNRISVVSISTSGLVTLSGPPRNGDTFQVHYFYELLITDRIDDWYREDIVASMEADLIQTQNRLDDIQNQIDAAVAELYKVRVSALDNLPRLLQDKLEASPQIIPIYTGGPPHDQKVQFLINPSYDFIFEGNITLKGGFLFGNIYTSPILSGDQTDLAIPDIGDLTVLVIRSDSNIDVDSIVAPPTPEDPNITQQPYLIVNGNPSGGNWIRFTPTSSSLVPENTFDMDDFIQLRPGSFWWFKYNHIPGQQRWNSQAKL